MLRFSLVEIGTGGRASCARCGLSRQAVDYLSAAEVTEHIRRAVAECPSPGPNVMLGGADAFGHPELPVLVNAATRDGAVRIGLETDGGALATSGNAAGALHAGVRHVRVSYADPPKALAGISAWAEAARTAGVAAVATAAVSLCVHNVTELAQGVAAMAEAGVAGVTLDGRSMRVTADVRAQVAAACDTGTVNGVWVEVLGPAELLPESHVLHLVRDGEAR
ncbi:MAG: hypothetical protein U1F44_00695 [Coriobacteriia bacterium]|nr:hypothetical protein [Coriobacteriia bacterium]